MLVDFILGYYFSCGLINEYVRWRYFGLLHDFLEVLLNYRESENACEVADESADGQFFVVGHRLLYSTSSITLSAEGRSIFTCFNCFPPNFR